MVTDTSGSIARVGAVILAAGRSTRMQLAKQLLPLGDSTILEQTIAHVREAEVEETVLVLGASAVSIQERLPVALLAKLKIVVNEAYAQGMASSLKEGISALDSAIDAALIILGDQPFVRSQTYDRIIHAYRRSPARIVIPSYQGSRGNPVLIDRSLFSEVMDLKGDVGCRSIFNQHLGEIVEVEVEDPGVLLDIDELADYERLKHRTSSGAE